MARYLKHDSPWLLALLATLVALGPLSVDMYLPAMPAMMKAFGTDIQSMHLTLSAYLTGFAVFHLICGPLADRYGRKPLLILGTGLFVLACVGCSFSTSVEELLAFRFLQGVGACVGPTLARTITRDIFGAQRAARALSLIAMLMAMAPAVAPTLGGAMLLFLPWPSIFIFLAVYGAIVILAIIRFLPESMPARQSLHPATIARNYGQLLADPVYWSVTAVGGLMYAALMAYLSSSSFVYIDMLGVPVEYFGLTFLSAVFGYMLGSGISARITAHYDSEQVVLFGTCLAFIATSLMWTTGSLFTASITALMAPMMLYSTALGMVLPHTMAIALRPFPHIAGTASALLGFIQMSLSALASALVGSLLADTPQPMLVSMFIISLLALALGVHVNLKYRAARP